MQLWQFHGQFEFGSDGNVGEAAFRDLRFAFPRLGDALTVRYVSRPTTSPSCSVAPHARTRVGVTTASSAGAIGRSVYCVTVLTVPGTPNVC